MGISFKVAKTGTRYRPKISQLPEILTDEENEILNVKSIVSKQTPADIAVVDDDIAGYLVPSVNSGRNLVSEDHEVSFSLNLFPDGFSIGKPTKGMHPLLQDVPKLLLPYDRAAERLFSAIEYGWFPGDVFDDIPCKYLNGTIVCEVCDYQNCMPKSGDSIAAGTEFPYVQKVRLQMCMENIVKDMPSISDDSWSYIDLLEAESRILKALQPVLCLDPNPSLDRLCRKSDSKKLDLGVYRRQKSMQSDVPSVKLSSNNISHGQNISSNGVHENSKSHTRLALGDGAAECSQVHISSSMPNIHHNIGQDALGRALPLASLPNYQLAVNCSESLPRTPAISSKFVSPGQDVTDSYNDPTNPGTFVTKKRDRRETQSTPKPAFKKPKLEHPDLVQQQLEAERIQCARFGGQRHPQMVMNDSPQAILEGVPKLEGRTPSCLDPRDVQYSVKNELTEASRFYNSEAEKNKDGHLVMDTGSDQQFSPFTRNHLTSPTQWGHLAQSLEKDPKKGDASQKRKSSQSPRVSAGGPVLSVEISSFSQGGPYSSCPTTALVGFHKEKAVSMSGATVGTASVSSGHSDSLLRENQASQPSKRKSNSRPKTSSMSGVGSPVSVGNTNAPFSANSPSIGTPPVPMSSGTKGDPTVLERFQKIDMVTRRFKLNYKNHKVDKYLERKPLLHSPQLLPIHLSQSVDTEEFKDAPNTMPLSKSILGGGINVCKNRILSFVRPGCVYQKNGIKTVTPESLNKLVMSVRSKDYMVEARVLYGDEEEKDILASQYSLQTLPNTHMADIFAAQYTSLMLHDRYQLIDDQVHPIPDRNIGAFSSQPALTSALPESGASLQTCSTPISCQSFNSVTPISNTISAADPQQLSSQNILARARMLPPSNLQSPQHQHPQFQRSLPLVGSNSLGNTNLQMGNQIVNNPALLHYQLQQQRQQLQQQQPIMQRKMMAGVLGVGMGNMSAMQPGGGSPGLGSMVGFGTTSNGSIGVAMSSAPMGGHVPGLSNLSQLNNLGQVSGFGLRTGGLSPAQAAALARQRLVQSRGRGMLSGGLIRNSTDGIGGIAGNGPMHGGSMLNQTLSRVGMAQLQRMNMASMGLPKVSGMNFYMNPQQQHIQQQQQLQQHQQQIGSPLQQSQVTGLTEQVGSPSAHVSPQQMSPQQLSSGVMPQQMNSGNIGVGSGSPQLSSHTLGSVGSITSSPMELQGVSKGSTVNTDFVGG
ncbi:protein PHYTOCHROME-DEPENDENT LATE-FLOWERING-like [Tasmannia lanceolata]|uniref:protein PHYTOCHROME-DEPENDENT LATE-FLOWERING-like n=1 Tax=Tasmannia lanceolata TaxID=3420 RepID=UPI004064B36B